ncbi:NLP/P60 protein [Mycolicibacterium conceptionense]|uniref:NLP/P60 protein n=1 Tax=Mycolicibacterium conceptionense TaxID=451644 RepID=A0A0U1DEE7_9MYCO|nr:NLP/P60 protein [Mycolicibacterium conceptionense]
MGVPYSWGGGTLTGPGPGVDYDAGKVGFDCSGLTRYAFAGVGVQIPKYSGDQYNTGRKVPVAQAKRGDLLFWGPAAASTWRCTSAAARCSRRRAVRRRSR